jgi:hypothetical protein
MMCTVHSMLVLTENGMRDMHKLTRSVRALDLAVGLWLYQRQIL